MKNRKAVLGAMLVFLSIPVLLVLVDAVSFRATNRPNGTLVVAGQEREYEVYVPRSYDRAKATPLVISIHGAGGWAVQQMQLSRWNQLADREGFIVVYPTGAREVGPRIWHVERDAGLTRDIAFISALIDTMEARYNIDPARIYANGISNGGGMTFVLSCTMSDRIAAFGMVAAAQTLPWSWCTDHRPAPMIAFHGTADPDIPYDGGVSPIAPDSFPNIRAWTRKWSIRNQCAQHPVGSVVTADVTRLEYTGCANDASVVLYTIRDGGHTWPGGEPMAEWWVGRTTNSISASNLMWTFFLQHPLARK